MQQRHFLCQLCQRAGIPHLYFADAASLRKHNGAAHFACIEAECQECLVVFATREELESHHLARCVPQLPGRCMGACGAPTLGGGPASAGCGSGRACVRACAPGPRAHQPSSPALCATAGTAAAWRAGTTAARARCC
jgi:hypothetical protein